MFELIDLHNLKHTLYNDLKDVNSDLYNECKTRLFEFHQYMFSYIGQVGDFIDVVPVDDNGGVVLEYNSSLKPFILENDICMTPSGVLFMVVSHEQSKFSIVYQLYKLRTVNNTFTYKIKYIDSFTTHTIILDHYKRNEATENDDKLREFMGYASRMDVETNRPIFEMFHGMDGVNVRLLKVELDQDDEDDDENLVLFKPHGLYNTLSELHLSNLVIKSDPVTGECKQTGVYQMLIYFTGIVPYENNLEFVKNVMIESYVKPVPQLQFLYDAIPSDRCISVILPTRGEWTTMDWNDVILNVNKETEIDISQEDAHFTKYRIEPSPGETVRDVVKSHLRESYTDDFFVLRSTRYGVTVVFPMETYIIPTTQPFLYVAKIQRFYRAFDPKMTSAQINYPSRRNEQPDTFFKKIMKVFLIMQFDYDICAHLLNSNKKEDTKILNVVKQIKQIHRFIKTTSTLNMVTSNSGDSLKTVCHNLKMSGERDRIDLEYMLTEDRIFDVFNIIIHMFNNADECISVISSVRFINVVYNPARMDLLRTNMLIPRNKPNVSEVIRKTFFSDDNYTQADIDDVLSSDLNVFITFIAISLFTPRLGESLLN